jgi:hypothetical protein
MKKITFTILILAFAFVQGFSQDEKTKHFEVDAMLGMHSYSNAFFHAINSVTWIQDPSSNMTEFSGYGKSIQPAVNISYFFKNSIGVTAGLLVISAENDLYVDDGSGSNYDFSADQYNVSFGVAGRIHSNGSPFSIQMGSGLVVANFDISESFTNNNGGTYLAGNDVGLGYYGSGAFRIRILSFLSFKTELAYSFIPAEITLYGSDGNIEQNINNLNIGGMAIKTGLSFQF